MSAIEWLFDIMLSIAVLVLAVSAMHARTLYTCAVFFIAFGLLLAITWGRLGAPDLALAEAALGAGINGVLLFSALPPLRAQAEEAPPKGMASRWLASAFIALTFALLLKSVWPLTQLEPILPEMIARHMSESGVDHPVTAVLLNFRAWDTLLELAVLLLALTGLRQLAPEGTPYPKPWRLLGAWGNTLAPLTVLVGGYLLWRGSSAPGGAFQAGALLAAGAVMLRLNGILPPLYWHWMWVRLMVLVGLLSFIAVALFTHWTGEGWLNFPTAWSGALILAIEVGATLSIATTLTLLVVGERKELNP